MLVKVLYSRCRQHDGQFRSTSALLLGTCQSYSNRNGQLYCDKNGSTAANSRWDGSYRDSCRDISVDKHGRLSATCRKENGKSNRTNITPQQCPSYRAGNSNGKLVCESQGNVSSRWEGSFQKSCRDISMNSSGTLTATCQTTGGNWQRTSLGAGQCNGSRAGKPSGGVMTVSAVRDKDHVDITVADDGRGMDPARRAMLPARQCPQAASCVQRVAGAVPAAPSAPH